jgi:hypothetical protein
MKMWPQKRMPRKDSVRIARRVLREETIPRLLSAGFEPVHGGALRWRFVFYS